MAHVMPAICKRPEMPERRGSMAWARGGAGALSATPID